MIAGSRAELSSMRAGLLIVIIAISVAAVGMMTGNMTGRVIQITGMDTSARPKTYIVTIQNNEGTTYDVVVGNARNAKEATDRATARYKGFTVVDAAPRSEVEATTVVGAWEARQVDDLVYIEKGGKKIIVSTDGNMDEGQKAAQVYNDQEDIVEHYENWRKSNDLNDDAETRDLYAQNFNAYTPPDLRGLADRRDRLGEITSFVKESLGLIVEDKSVTAPTLDVTEIKSPDGESTIGYMYGGKKWLVGEQTEALKAMLASSEIQKQYGAWLVKTDQQDSPELRKRWIEHFKPESVVIDRFGSYGLDSDSVTGALFPSGTPGEEDEEVPYKHLGIATVGDHSGKHVYVYEGKWYYGGTNTEPPAELSSIINFKMNHPHAKLVENSYSINREIGVEQVYLDNGIYLTQTREKIDLMYEVEELAGSHVFKEYQLKDGRNKELQGIEIGTLDPATNLPNHQFEIDIDTLNEIKADNPKSLTAASKIITYTDSAGWRVEVNLVGYEEQLGIKKTTYSRAIEIDGKSKPVELVLQWGYAQIKLEEKQGAQRKLVSSIISDYRVTDGKVIVEQQHFSYFETGDDDLQESVGEWTTWGRDRGALVKFIYVEDNDKVILKWDAEKEEWLYNGQTAEKSENELVKRALKSKTKSQFRRFAASTEFILSEFSGLSGFSRLLFDRQDLDEWRQEVDNFFCSTVLFGGEECWSSVLCNQKIESIPDNVLVVESPTGLLMTAAHIEADRSQPLDGPDGAEYLYKLTFVVNNVDHSGYEGLGVNLELRGATTAKVFAADLEADEGEALRYIGEEAIVQYSFNLYNEACLVFDRKLFTPDDESYNEVCVPIAESAAPATGYSSPSQGGQAGQASGNINDF